MEDKFIIDEMGLWERQDDGLLILKEPSEKWYKQQAEEDEEMQKLINKAKENK